MTEIENRKRWNALMGSTTAMRGYSGPARSFVRMMEERNQGIINELQAAELEAQKVQGVLAVIQRREEGIDWLAKARQWIGGKL